MLFVACNIVSTSSEGVEQLTSFGGQRRNCSLLIAYPAEIDIFQLTVGQPTDRRTERNLAYAPSAAKRRGSKKFRLPNVIIMRLIAFLRRINYQFSYAFGRFTSTIVQALKIINICLIEQNINKGRWLKAKINSDRCTLIMAAFDIIVYY